MKLLAVLSLSLLFVGSSIAAEQTYGSGYEPKPARSVSTRLQRLSDTSEYDFAKPPVCVHLPEKVAFIRASELWAVFGSALAF